MGPEILPDIRKLAYDYRKQADLIRSYVSQEDSKFRKGYIEGVADTLEQVSYWLYGNMKPPLYLNIPE